MFVEFINRVYLNTHGSYTVGQTIDLPFEVAMRCIANGDAKVPGTATPETKTAPASEDSTDDDSIATRPDAQVGGPDEQASPAPPEFVCPTCQRSFAESTSPSIALKKHRKSKKH